MNLHDPKNCFNLNVFLYHRYWYKNGCLFPDMASAFIAIDKCDVENGCLKVNKLIPK